MLAVNKMLEAQRVKEYVSQQALKHASYPAPVDKQRSLYNKRVHAAAFERMERLTKQRNELVISPIVIESVPIYRRIMLGLFGVNRFTKYLHFSLQFGRLKIEFLRAVKNDPV